MTAREEDLTGAQLGHIQLTELLGSGGMGTVYAGLDRRLGRRVAVKLIRSERRMSPRARARFLREAKLLSQLNHPGICQIHDILDTPEGECLVLELVEGRSLRAALMDGLSRDAALRITEQLLEVLAAVHRKDIVHRDLKPGNVMLTPDGGIKVLDFGIAREADLGEAATGPPDEPLDSLDTADLPETIRGSLVGTPRYMSPEQARGEEVTPASDLYALGLMLVEMLTGKPALDPGGSPAELLQRASWGDVRELEDVPAALRPFVRRLLSLAPSDRPSARDALDQLRRILDMPRRRRRRLAATAVTVALAVLAAGMGVQWRRASREAERARRALAESRAVSDFLSGLFQRSNPFAVPSSDGGQGKTVTAEQLLEDGSATIRHRFADQPLTQARFMTLLGRIQLNLGHFDRASELLEGAVAALENHPEAAPRDLAVALRELGEMRRRQARLDEATALLNRAAGLLDALDPPAPLERTATEEVLALVDLGAGRPRDARDRLAHVVEVREALQGGEHPDLALSLLRLGNAEAELGDYGPARSCYVRALAIEKLQLGASHPGLISLYNQLGSLESRTGQPGQAEQHFRAALEICSASLEPKHPLRATLSANLANALNEQGRPEEAERWYREALRITRHNLGADHPRTGSILLNLGMDLQNLGRAEEAEATLRQAVAVLRTSLGAGHPNTAVAMNSLAVLLAEQERYGEAATLYRKARRAFAASLGTEHPYVAMVANNLAEIARLQGRLDEAERGYREALAIDEKSLGTDHPALGEVLRGLALTLAAKGRDAEAEDAFSRALAILQGAGAPAGQLRKDYAAFLDGQGRRDEAERILRPTT